MTKQDSNGVRTPQDLERKYNFSQLLELKKNYELQKQGINKVENELKNFVINTTKNLDELQNQVDGNITTWFYNGVPSNENKPANEWSTEKEKINHLGDLYYDQDTGYAYRWAYIDDNYQWSKIVDADVVKALAVANKAKDTADSKRRIFVEKPSPPYDCGDLWIKEEELYRCQTTKLETEKYEDNDWIIATKYTDDTKANQVGENLKILSGTVTEIRKGVNELSSTMTNTTKLVDEQGKEISNLETKTSETSQTVDSISSTVSAISSDLNNNYTANEELNQKLAEQKNSITNEMTTKYEQSKESFTFDILNKINKDGISTLKNTMVTIDENGITTAKNNEDIVSLLDNVGLSVSDGVLNEDNSNILMRVDRNGGYLKTAEIKSTIKEQDIIQKEQINDETYGICQVWYWIGDDE